MSYTVIITPAAARQLTDLPGQLAEFIREQLLHLMENPAVLSKPATILQPRGQLFEFKYDSGGVVVWISVIFRYGQDEQTIHIEDIDAEFG